MGNNIVTELSSNIRSIARIALQGKWKTAILTIFVALLLVAVPTMVVEKLIEGQPPSEAFLINLISILIGGPIALGTCIFFLRLFRNQEINVGILFSGFEAFGKAALLRFITGLFILLWSFLFIIPGIIAAIRYSQAVYILADNPEMGIMECIQESKTLMGGNKWKYFCLNISFLGWAILASIPAGFGWLILLPYIGVSQTAFYEMAIGHLRPQLKGGE